MRQCYRSGYNQGRVIYHFVRDEIELAMDWMEKAIAQRDAIVPISVHILGKKFRLNPRWPTLLAMMNLPAEDHPTSQ